MCHLCSLHLKVLSSEIYPAEVRFIQNAFIKDRGAEDFRKIRVNFLFFLPIGGLECVDHSFAQVVHFVFLKHVWIRTQRAAIKQAGSQFFQLINLKLPSSNYSTTEQTWSTRLFLQQSAIGTPAPSPAGECVPSSFGSGGAYSLAGGGVGGGPNVLCIQHLQPIIKHHWWHTSRAKLSRDLLSIAVSIIVYIKKQNC